MTTRTTIAFLGNVFAASQIEGQRGRLDIFSDRLLKAASEPTLAGAMEQLLRAVNAEAERLHPPLAAAMLRVANSPDGPRVLRWIREQTKLVALLAATTDSKVVEEALAELQLPPAQQPDIVPARTGFAIELQVHCQAPLAHGADQKAGNATLFRRMQVLGESGGVLSLPYYAGNAVRGQVRDLLADHFLAAIGLTPDRATPPVALWFFYALYAGGALEENAEATKAMRKQLGDNGSIRAEGIRRFRDMLPALSLLGCALGNRVLPGHVQFADLRPRCLEWGTGDKPVAELLTWEFLTRREDHEAHAEHHGMIANTEVLRAGTDLEGGVDHDQAIPQIERAALALGLELLAQRGFLGAENSRGIGRVGIGLGNCPESKPYTDWLAAHRDEIRAYLVEIGALDPEVKF